VLLVYGMGNWGDSLIRAGSRNILRGIEFDELSVRRIHNANEGHLIDVISRYKLVLMNGGMFYKDRDPKIRLVEFLADHAASLTLMPSSFEDDDFPVRLADKGVTVFSREMSAKGTFCHDTAFSLNEDTSKHKEHKTCLVLRGDREAFSRGSMLARRSRDISAEGSAGDCHLKFMNEISGFSEIITDRLHVGIGGLKTGADVTFVTNSFKKITNIYESSVEGFYENARLMDGRTIWRSL